MSKILIKNARLSYPSLFKKSVYEGKEGKYEATFLIDKKDEALKKQIDNEISKLLLESKVKVNPEKFCIKDGDESEKEGYQGNWSFKASSDRRPQVIDRDKTPLTADDEKFYAGCYVNAVVDLWVQNNGYGKRVNSNLYGVQFLKDGEPLGNSSIDVIDDFEDLDDL